MSVSVPEGGVRRGKEQPMTIVSYLVWERKCGSEFRLIGAGGRIIGLCGRYMADMFAGSAGGRFRSTGPGPETWRSDLAIGRPIRKEPVVPVSSRSFRRRMELLLNSGHGLSSAIDGRMSRRRFPYRNFGNSGRE
jgi:hypothetical protein